jgi:hypothetical protein
MDYEPEVTQRELDEAAVEDLPHRAAWLGVSAFPFIQLAVDLILGPATRRHERIDWASSKGMSMKRAIVLSLLCTTFTIEAQGQFNVSDGLKRLGVQNTSESIAYVDGVKYACSETGIASAVLAVGLGGSVHAEGCLTPFTWSGTLTITSPVNLYLPCTTMTFITQIMAVQSNDVHIHTCGSGTSGQVNQGKPAVSATQFVARGISKSTNAIVVSVPLAKRTSIATARTSGFTIEPIYIDMNGLGNRAIYTSSCWQCKIDRPVIANAACGSGPDGAITVEADLTGDTTGAASYFIDLEFPEVYIAAGNATCHPYFFDARNGEISQGTYRGLTALPVDQNSFYGSDGILIQAGTSSAIQSFDKGDFIFPYLDNQSGGAYGIRLECPGNFDAGTNGRCFQITFNMPHLERLTGSPSGTGIGCTKSGVANGAGCGGITLINPVMGNYRTYIDYPNLGQMGVGVNDQSNPEGSILHFGGPIVGSNAYAISINGMLTPGTQCSAAKCNNQIVGAIGITPSIDKGSAGLTGTKPIGINLDCVNGRVSGKGALGTYNCLNINGDPNIGSSNYALNLNGGTVNFGKASVNGGNSHAGFVFEAGSCSMSDETTCTFSVGSSFTFVTNTQVSLDASSTAPAIAISAKCSISGTTVTVTAGASNSLTWDCLVVGK